MGGFIVCTAQQINSGDQIQESRMGVACSTCGGEGSCLHGSGGGN